MSDKEETKADDAGETEEQKVIPCWNCEADCWRRGWVLPAETEGEEPKDLCDNCLLFTKGVTLAQRRFDGKIKPLPEKKNKKPKPAAAKKKTANKHSLKD